MVMEWSSQYREKVSYKAYWEVPKLSHGTMIQESTIFRNDAKRSLRSWFELTHSCYTLSINIFEVNARMGKLGWHLNPLQFPSGLHICLTKLHVENNITESFLIDLRTIVEKMLQDPEKKVSSQVSATRADLK